MKNAISFFFTLALAMGAYAGGQSAPSAKQGPRDGLKVEIQTSSVRVRLRDKITLTVLFRSPDRDVTIWNAIGWGLSAGLSLQVQDSTGRAVKNDFGRVMFEYLPPDTSGKNALISIGGQRFAGFDSQIPVDLLFPRPGNYSLKCVYTPPLPRDYFHGNVIWGKEDGAVESAMVAVSVDK